MAKSIVRNMLQMNLLFSYALRQWVGGCGFGCGFSLHSIIVIFFLGSCVIILVSRVSFYPTSARSGRLFFQGRATVQYSTVPYLVPGTVAKDFSRTTQSRYCSGAPTAEDIVTFIQTCLVERLDHDKSSGTK